jgi:small subunit ribosomal protein S20
LLKTKVRRFEQAVEAGDRESAEKALREAMKAFDHAAAKGVVHRNKAANSKSRLSKRLSSV